MSTIRITKEFSFEMAHALTGYEGPCRHIHGHSYHLAVTVKGNVLESDSDPKNGMVMDFGDLKAIVKELVIDRLDHALMLEEGALNEELVKSSRMLDRIVWVPYTPTCENMLGSFAKEISAALPSHYVLHSLKLKETPTSFAEWYAEDNARK
jgi:6-pyruvoyltetrahydropterin/6-carboxytetrahydropterin synthase